MNHLRSLGHLMTRWLPFFALLGLAIVTSCDDDEKPNPVTVEFSTGDIAVNEDGGPQTITISFDKAAIKDGTIEISASGTDFLTVPSEVQVAKGNTSAQFVVTPVNNATINGSQQITLTLTDTDDGFKLGTKTSITVTVLDDEGPVTATFQTSTGTVPKTSTEGIAVTILLSNEAEEDGTVVISYTPADAAITTQPAATSGNITVPVEAGDESVSFTVIPGSTITSDLVVNFSLASATGGVIAGTTNKTYALTITSTVTAVTKTITEIRAMHTGTDVTLTEDINVTGTVISTIDNTNNRNIWIHDGTKGIQVRFAAVHSFTQGQQLLIKLPKGAVIGRFSNGPLQIGSDSKLPLDSGKVNGTGTIPTVKTISIADLNTGDYEGDLVKIENVHFSNANGTTTFKSSVNSSFTDGTNTASFRVETYAPFTDNVIPSGNGTLAGIANVLSGTKQLTPNKAEDIFTSNTTASLTVSETSLPSFGDVTKGQVSAAKSFTIQGTTLTADVTVTAPNNFTVSKTEAGTYASSIIIDAASANAAAVTVYVKFAPNSGVNQPLSGDISVASTGAATKTVSVSGTEIGNVASAKQTLALWTFETNLPGTLDATTVLTIAPESGLQTSTANASAVHASSSAVYSSPVGNGSGKSLSSNFWDANDYYQFAVNSTGFSNITVSWDQTRSGSGPSAFALYYSTNGTDFTKHADYTVTQVSWTGSASSTASSFSYDLSAVTALNNASTLVFRLVETATGVSSGGTNRVDNIKVEGE